MARNRIWFGLTAITQQTQTMGQGRIGLRFGNARPAGVNLNNKTDIRSKHRSQRKIQMNEKKTCGDLYLEALREIPTEPERRAFAHGFVSGQAEKVYLGACQAAMFRPSNETMPWLLPMTRDVCRRYGLECELLGQHCTGLVPEIWIWRRGGTYGAWLQFPKDSAQWHVERARACGIPEHEIDLNFHERRSYEQPCDQGALVGTK